MNKTHLPEIGLLLAFLSLLVVGVNLVQGRGLIPQANPDPVADTVLSTPFKADSVPSKGGRCEFDILTPSAPQNLAEPPELSASRIVFTASGALHLAQWLPDSQRILFTRDLPRINRQRIGVFNPFTSQFTPHAERNFNGNRPLWLPEHDTVAYLDWGFNEQSQGRVSYTLITDHRSLITEISSPFFALTVEERLIFFTQSNGYTPQSLIANLQSPITDYQLPNLTTWQTPAYPKTVEDFFRLTPFQIAPRPSSGQILFYTQPWTLLTEGASVCSIDLGHVMTSVGQVPVWALDARWSPDGRYLALITTSNFPGQERGTGGEILATELTLVDFQAGILRTLVFTPDITPGHHYVTDLAWGPDSRFLAVMGVLGINEFGTEEGGVFMVEAATGAARLAATGEDLGGGVWGTQLIWSPDGAFLMANCPTRQEGRLCMLAVEK